MLSKPIITKPLRQKTPACLPFPLGRGSASYVRMHVEYLLADTFYLPTLSAYQGAAAKTSDEKLTSGSPARPGGRGEVRRRGFPWPGSYPARFRHGFGRSVLACGCSSS